MSWVTATRSSKPRLKSVWICMQGVVKMFRNSDKIISKDDVRSFLFRSQYMYFSDLTSIFQMLFSFLRDQNFGNAKFQMSWRKLEHYSNTNKSFHCYQLIFDGDIITSSICHGYRFGNYVYLPGWDKLIFNQIMFELT